MSAVPDYSRERSSESPIAIDLSEGTPVRADSVTIGGVAVPQSVVGMVAYLGTGVLLGVVVLFALGVGRNATGAASEAGEMTDPIMRLHAREIGDTCWQGLEKRGPARLTVALQVGTSGKVQYAAASGATTVMRGCVEAHVKAWEFLPQQAPQSMALPFEVDRR